MSEAGIREKWFSERLGVPVQVAVVAEPPAGRTALRAVTPHDVAFPHPTVSLTHAGGLAVAVCTEGTAGVGVDHEPWRAVDPRMLRFFLTPDDAPGDPLRLWTVKEALFKATADNGSYVLTDFTVVDGSTGRGPRGEHLTYATTDLPTGPLTIAVRKEGT